MWTLKILLRAKLVFFGPLPNHNLIEWSIYTLTSFRFGTSLTEFKFKAREWGVISLVQYFSDIKCKRVERFIQGQSTLNHRLRKWLIVLCNLDSNYCNFIEKLSRGANKNVITVHVIGLDFFASFQSTKCTYIARDFGHGPFIK